MQLNKTEILRLVEEGFLMVNTHPDYPLQILNYTRKTQFERAWNEYTLLSRGLIIDESFKVIAMPFKKFFNYEELIASPIYPNAPIKDYEVYEKMDGSLGIIFYYDGLWHIATRGSFASDQSIRGKSILEKHNLDNLNPENTYLVEILYKENRIVVRYDDEKLVLLGIMNRETGYDYTYDEIIEKVAFEWPTVEVVKRYDSVDDISILKSRNILNKEGYVMRLRGTDFRMKCKFEDYCRLHSIITNVSTKDIWACLRDGRDLNELLENTPDEFDEWVRGQIKLLKDQFNKIEYEASHEFMLLFHSMNLQTKKEFAELALKSKNRGILFNMFSGKSYSQIIWKMIEPKWSKPFFKQNDEEVD